MDCLFCSSRGFQEDRLQEGKKLAARQDQSMRPGLCCSNCQRFACRMCMVAIVKEAAGSARNDPWCIAVNTYLETDIIPCQFIGSCCELKLELEELRPRGQPQNNTADDTVDDSFSDKKAARNNRPGKRNRAKKAKLSKLKNAPLNQCDLPIKQEKIRYGGSIHFPEFDLLVDAPFDCVDIHGLGECGEAIGVVEGRKQWKIHFNPVAHCVVSEEASALYESTNATASGRAGEYSSEIHTISIEAVDDPSQIINLNVNTIVFDTRNTCIPKLKRGKHELGAELKGQNNPSRSALERSTFLTSADMKPRNGDHVHGTVVIGRYPWTEHQSCLVLRLFDKRFVMCMEKNQIQKLYKAAIERIPRGGFVARRFGGSSGFALLSYWFFKFIHGSGNLPRAAHGCKFIRRGTYWLVIYMSTKYDKKRYGNINERGHEDSESEWSETEDDLELKQTVHVADEDMKAVSVRYSPPLPGGAFHVDPDLLEKIPELYTFAEAKVAAAQLLNNLNQLAPFQIQIYAVEHEISTLERARRYASLMRRVNVSKKEAILINFIGENKHTLVQHPVGYHYDFFHLDKPGLENKQCLPCDERTMQYGPGRGGRGPNNFVFAILDWRYECSGLRRQIYLQNGGPVIPAVRQDIWDAFAEDQPEVRAELNARFAQQDEDRAARRNQQRSCIE